MYLCDGATNTPDAAGMAPIEAALRHLLADETIRLSERNRRFLDFVVRETLAGRGDRIKAYSIGVDVFGRGDDFDPNNDPIVRIEASRMRAALAAYYRGPGRGDSVRIVMRPGSYVPAFESASTLGSRPMPAEGPCTVVVGHLTAPTARNTHARGMLLVDAIVQKLVASGMRTFFSPSGRQNRALKERLAGLGEAADLYRLEITVHEIAEGRRYSWLVSEFESGEIRGIGSIDLDDDTLPSGGTINEIADLVLRSISVQVG